MKKTGLMYLYLVLLVSFLSACATAQVVKEELKEGENLSIDIESINFYEKLTVVALGGGKSKVEIGSVPRNDEFSKEMEEKFKEKFSQAAQEKGVVVSSNAPIKLKINLAYGVNPVEGGEIRILAVAVSISKLTINGPALIVNMMGITHSSVPYKLQAAFESFQILESAKKLSDNLGGRIINDIIFQLRAKGELKK